MAYTAVNPVSVDEATKADDYDVVFDNIVSVASFRNERAMGGDYHTAYTDTTYVAIEQYKTVTINGTYLSGLTVSFNCMGFVASGTGYVRLYNGTLAAPVAGGEIAFTNTSVGILTTSALTLASGTNFYYIQIKGSTAAALPRVWSCVLDGWNV